MSIDDGSGENGAAESGGTDAGGQGGSQPAGGRDPAAGGEGTGQRSPSGREGEAGDRGQPGGTRQPTSLMDMDGDGEGDQGEGEAARSDTPRGQEGLEGPRLDDGKLFWGQRPDWLPENFFDGKTGEVKLEALAKSQADLRKQISSGDHKPPPKPEGYDFTPSEENAKIASAIIQGDDDPLVSGFRARAHELGLSQTQASALFNGFLQDAEAILPAPLDVQAEMKKLGPNARGVIQHMKSRADHLEKLGVFDQTTKQEFLLAAGTADGIRMLDAFAQSFGAPRLTDVLRQEMQSSPQAEEFRAKRQELGTRLDKKELTPVQYEREMKKLQDEQDALSGGG